MNTAQVQATNHLLGLFPEMELAALLHHCAEVPLIPGKVLPEAVYFPLSGLIATFVTTHSGKVMHTRLVGREGGLGLESLASPNAHVPGSVLAAGRAVQVAHSVFQEACDRNHLVQAARIRYCEFITNYAYQSMACNALHSAKQRSCTWLLRADDRLPNQALPITQKLLAQTLGLRRTTVTLIAQFLQKENILHYSRGNIHVTNRSALEAQACDCYQMIKFHLDRCLSEVS
jgi:CRP-like cAMP-binding protein